jgi:hypothetical protein
VVDTAQYRFIFRAGGERRAPLPSPTPAFHRRARRGIQEEVTMLELFILAAGFAGGYAASVYSWPQIRISAIGFTAEINQLRACAKLLEDQLREAAKGGV